MNEARVLYTIRLEPSVIAKLNAIALTQGKTQAAVARDMLTIGSNITGKKPKK